MQVPVYTLYALSARINKDPHTLRLWEARGVLPEPMFRGPSRGARAGKRLYTLGEIDVIARTVEEFGPGRGRLVDEGFKRTLRDRLNVVRVQYQAPKRNLQGSSI